MIADWLASPLLETFGMTLLHSLWQLSLIAAITALLLLTLRRASANIRYALCCFAMLVMVMTPPVTFRYLQARTVIPPAIVAQFHESSAAAPIAFPTMQLTASALPAPTLPPTDPFHRSLPYLSIAYLAGALLVTLRLFRGYVHLRRLRRSATPLNTDLAVLLASLAKKLHVSQPVRLLHSTLIEVPTVLGHFRPIILLPATSLTGLSSDQLSAILAHELAHIRRHDFLVNLLQTLIETLLFYHPATWWLSHKIRQEREHACDDLAVRSTDRVTYATALTKMESLRASPSLALAANSARLLPRIQRILQIPPAPSRNRRTVTLSSTLVAALVIAALCYLIACSHLRSGSTTLERTYDLQQMYMTARGEKLPPAATEEIADVVKSSVAPESWRDNGGNVGSIEIRGDKLVITHTREIHSQISNFLETVLDRPNYADNNTEDPHSAAHYAAIVRQLDRTIQEQLKTRTDKHPEVMELRRHREAAQKLLEARQREDAQNAATEKGLNANLRELEADHQSFEKVIAYLRDSGGLNIWVNWNALEKAGVDRNTPVTVRLRNVPFRKVLATVLSEVDGGAAHISFTVVDGVITISTKEDLEASEDQMVRVYDIRDMLIQPDFNVRPPFGGGEPPAGPAPVAKTRDDIVREIIHTVTTTVSPKTWRDAGGKIGAIRELNGQLIINQTVRNQRAVLQLLTQLRETRAVQIAIEARLVLVDDATYLKLNLAEPRGKDQQGNVVDDEQLKKVFETLKSSANVAVLDYPRVTLFNGQRGFIADTKQVNYVRACKSKKDDNGKLVPDYEIDTLTSGNVLFIENTVTADRQSAVIKARPTIRQLDKIEKFPAPGMPDSPEFYIQKPLVRESQIESMCAVPDRRTLILAGTKVTGTLPHTPGFNGTRLQDSRPAGEAQIDRHLLIFIRPQIITQSTIVLPPANSVPVKPVKR